MTSCHSGFCLQKTGIYRLKHSCFIDSRLRGNDKVNIKTVKINLFSINITKKIAFYKHFLYFYNYQNMITGELNEDSNFGNRLR